MIQDDYPSFPHGFDVHRCLRVLVKHDIHVAFTSSCNKLHLDLQYFQLFILPYSISSNISSISLNIFQPFVLTLIRNTIKYFNCQHLCINWIMSGVLVSIHGISPFSNNGVHVFVPLKYIFIPYFSICHILNLFS